MHDDNGLVAGERVVAVGGLECMCGGTHVKNTLDIKGATALRIKKVSGKSCVESSRRECMIV